MRKLSNLLFTNREDKIFKCRGWVIPSFRRVLAIGIVLGLDMKGIFFLNFDSHVKECNRKFVCFY